MSKENEDTLATYDIAAQIYLDNTITHDKKYPTRALNKKKQLADNLKKAFGVLPKGVKILEIGSADGENAKVIKSFGFDVIASDVAPAFLAACKKQNLKTIKLNVLKDDLPAGIYGVLCWRVLVHFTPSDIKIALQKIYDALTPNGRLVFNVIDNATHEHSNQWVDFEGEYKMGAKRYYAYYSKDEIINIIKETKFKIVSDWHEHGGHNDWFCFVLEKQTEKVSDEITSYIEAKILPKYNKLGGHTDKHIRQVIERSLRFYQQSPNLNIDMVYVIAAYHDLGRLIDNETHNIESAKLLRKDEFIKNHFSSKEIDIMAEAIEDHRASLGREPRSIYGKLVSSADRNANIGDMLSRVYDYTKHLHPEMDEAGILEEARCHLRSKYSPNGYAAKTMYFDDPDFAATLTKVEEITRSPEKFTKIMCEHNAKRKSTPNKKGLKAFR